MVPGVLVLVLWWLAVVSPAPSFAFHPTCLYQYLHISDCSIASKRRHKTWCSPSGSRMREGICRAVVRWGASPSRSTRFSCLCWSALQGDLIVSTRGTACDIAPRHMTYHTVWCVCACVTWIVGHREPVAGGNGLERIKSGRDDIRTKRSWADCRDVHLVNRSSLLNSHLRILCKEALSLN